MMRSLTLSRKVRVICIFYREQLGFGLDVCSGGGRHAVCWIFFFFFFSGGYVIILAVIHVGENLCTQQVRCFQQVRVHLACSSVLNWLVCTKHVRMSPIFYCT